MSSEIYKQTSLAGESGGIRGDFDSETSSLRSPDSGSIDPEQHLSLTSNNVSAFQLPISRPLSRNSMASDMSVTATKDGIEGKHVKRTGIPSYPLNLINKMYANYASRSLEQTPTQSSNLTYGEQHADDGASVLSLSSMIPQYSAANSESGSITSKEDAQNYTTLPPQNGGDKSTSSQDQQPLDDYSKFLEDTSHLK